MPLQRISPWDGNVGPILKLDQKSGENQDIFCLNGGAEGDRTPDLRNAIATLSQLSYGPTSFTPVGETSPTGKGGIVGRFLGLVVLAAGLDAEIVITRLEIDFLVRAGFLVLVDRQIVRGKILVGLFGLLRLRRGFEC